MHIAFLTTEYPILGMKCGGIGIFIKHLSHLIVKSETGVKVSVVYWGNKFTETVWDDGISVIPINQPHKSPFSSFINRAGRRKCWFFLFLSACVYSSAAPAPVPTGLSQ